jgi:hypothetical protein
VIVDVAQNESVTLELEGEADSLVEASLEYLSVAQPLDLLGLEAGIRGSGESMARPGSLARTPRQAIGCLANRAV